MVKLVVSETETAALLAWLRTVDLELVAADLARTELIRSVRRVAPDRMLRAREVLDSVTLMQVSTATFEAAGMLLPGSLRSLDAIHLASAMALGDELAGLLTYDSRLAAAAEEVGITVVAPK